MAHSQLHSSSSSAGGERGDGTKRRAQAVSQKLQVMECPHVEGMEEDVIQEVILTPGDARTRIIQWLLGRFHPILCDLLFITDVSMTTVPRLTALLSEMGLCSREDYELVRGTTTLKRQVLFLEALIGMVEIASWDSLDDSLTHESLSNKAERCCFFTDALCRQEALSSTFPQAVSLLPPDVARLSNSCSDDGGGNAEGRRTEKRAVSAPSLGSLKREVDKAKAELEEKQRELEAVMETHTYTSLNTSAMESSYKTLTVNMSTLQQLITNFSHCYEMELQPWTNRDPPDLSGFGPLCKRVNTHIQHTNKLLGSLSQLETSLSTLRQLQAPPTTENTAVFSPLFRRADEVFRECLEISGQTLSEHSP